MTDYEKMSLMLLSTIADGISQLVVSNSPEGPGKQLSYDWQKEVFETIRLVRESIPGRPTK